MVVQPFNPITPETTARAQQGDKDAFSRIVRAYQAKVRAYISVQTSNGSDVDDLAQDVFIIAFRKLQSLNDPRKIWPWLRGIIRNEVANHHRGLDRRQKAFSSLIMAQSSLAHMFESESAGRLGIFHTLEACLQDLSERGRRLVTMRYEKGLSFGRIRQAVDSSEGALYALHFRVMDRLRECMRKKSGISQGPAPSRGEPHGQ